MGAPCYGAGREPGNRHQCVPVRRLRVPLCLAQRCIPSPCPIPTTELPLNPHLSGIGFAATRKLNSLQLFTIRDVAVATATVPLSTSDLSGGVTAPAVALGDSGGKAAAVCTALRGLFGDRVLRSIAELCRGIDRSPVARSAECAKTVSVEDSFWNQPVCSLEALKQALVQLARALLNKLHMEDSRAGVRVGWFVKGSARKRLAVLPFHSSNVCHGTPAWVLWHFYVCICRFLCRCISLALSLSPLSLCVCVCSQMNVFPSPQSVGELGEQCLPVTPAWTICSATFPGHSTSERRLALTS